MNQKYLFVLIFCIAAMMDLKAQYSQAHSQGYRMLDTKVFRYDNDHDAFEFKTPMIINSFYVIVKDVNVSFRNVLIYFTDGTKKSIDIEANLFPDVYSKIFVTLSKKTIQKMVFYHGVKVTKNKVKPKVELWIK